MGVGLATVTDSMAVSSLTGLLVGFAAVLVTSCYSVCRHAPPRHPACALHCAAAHMSATQSIYAITRSLTTKRNCSAKALTACLR